MTSCFFCNCFSKKSSLNGTNGGKSEDSYENETYSSVPLPTQPQVENNSSSRAPFFKFGIFKFKHKNDANNSQSGENVCDGRAQAETSKKNRKSSLWAHGRKKSTISGGPTYDYIDTEGGSFDAVYSRVDENPISSQRYEYPTFLMNSRRRNAPELFYTSASQIYSAGSEDPYSSIISGDNARNNYDVESNSSVYDVGYARVQNGGSMSGKKHSRSMSRPLTTTARNIDSLYTKINRTKKLNALVDASSESSIDVASKNGGTTAEMVHFSNGDVLTTTSPPLPTGTVDCLPSTSRENYEKSSVNGLKTLPYPIEESDSESMGSYYTGTGSSQNPSYRYLTVRESVDVIRERIRRQELEAASRTRQEDLAPSQREHYYSTIPNEYESVGDESSTPTTSSAVEEDRLRQQNIALRYSSPLSLSIMTNQYHHRNFSPNNTLQRNRISDNSSIAPELAVATPSIEPPPPPTSPIPNRCGDDASARSLPPPIQQPPHPVSILRPVILSSASNTISSRHSMVLMSTSTGGNGSCSSNGGGAVGILTAPFNNIRNTARFGKNESANSSTHHLLNGNHQHSNGHTSMGLYHSQQSSTGSNLRLDRIEGVMPRLSAIIRGKHRELANGTSNGLHYSSKRKNQPTVHLKHNGGHVGELSRHGCVEDGGVPPPLPPLPTPCIANLVLSKDFTEMVTAGGTMNGVPRTSSVVAQDRDELAAGRTPLISPTFRILIPLSARLSGGGAVLLRSCTPSPTVDVVMQTSAASSVVYRSDNQRGNTVDEMSSSRRITNGRSSSPLTPVEND